MANRDNLHRTEDGLYLAGVYVRPDRYGGYVARVSVAVKGPQPGEVITQHALTLDRAPTLDEAAEKAHAWASAHIPRIFEFAAGDLRVELMGTAEFG